MPSKLMSPELKDALEQVIEHLHKHPNGADVDGKLAIECGRKYIRIWDSWAILVLLPNGDAFEPRHVGGGRLPNWERPMGNIIRLVQSKNWQKRVRFVLGGFNYPRTISLGPAPQVPSCEGPGCRRTNKVRQTVVGMRCAYCRAVDIRHINEVRQLGGMPRIGSRALPTNEDYYKTA